MKRHWTKQIEPHLGDARLNAVLVRDYNKYTSGNWGKPFTRGQFPRDFESYDWDNASIAVQRHATGGTLGTEPAIGS